MSWVHHDVKIPRWIIYGAGAFDYMVAVLRFLRPALLAALIAAAIPCGLFFGCRAVKLIVPKAAQVSP